MIALRKKAAQTASNPLLEARIEHLRSVSLFQDIKSSHDALASMAEIMSEKTYRPGEAIIEEGEAGAELYILIQGQASVYKSTIDHDLYKVAVIEGEKHAFFGEGALLDSDSRSATIVADSECHCLVLTRKSFDLFSERHSPWALPVLHRIACAVMARLKKSNDDLTLLYNALVAEIRGHQ